MILEDALLTTLLDLGGIGILAGFLMWIHVQNTRRLDAMQDKHDKLLGDWRDERIETVERLIDQVTAVDGRFEGINVKLEEALSRIDTGLKEMRDHYQEARLKELTDQQR